MISRLGEYFRENCIRKIKHPVQFHVVKFTLFAINFVYAIYILEVREHKMENKE